MEKSITEVLDQRKIICVDFDGTIIQNQWPEMGKIRQPVVDKMKKEKAQGTYIIIHTCRGGGKLHEMQEFLEENNIPYDRINLDAPWIVDAFKRAGAKPYAHEYIDDKGVNVEDWIKGVEHE